MLKTFSYDNISIKDIQIYKGESMLAQGKILRNVLIMNMDKQLEDISMKIYRKGISELNLEEAYIVVVCMTKRLMETFICSLGEKKLYYISAYFEKGKFLENNLRNLGIYDILEGVLISKGQELSLIEKVEEEYIGKSSSFGRTSEAFFEQLRKNGLPGEAIGIRTIRRYEDRDKITESYEKEKSWLVKTENKFQLCLNCVKAQAVLYDMDVVGEDKEIYRYRIFDLEIEDGIMLEEKKIYYKYFLVSGAVKLILQEMREKHYDLRKMDEYAQIRFDDKYLAFVIPELIRILVDEKAFPLEEAIEIAGRICGYPDLKKMEEAISQCPIEFVDVLVPKLRETMMKLMIKKEDEQV